MLGIFNDCYPPVMDGVSVTIHNYAYWLHKKGEDVCVVTPSAVNYRDQDPFPVYRYRSLPLLFRKPYRMGFPQYDKALQRRLDQTDFSLVHAHSPFSSGKLALHLARERKIPLVATFHSKYRSDFQRVIPFDFVVDHLIKGIIDFYNQADEVWIPQASVEATIREYGYQGKVVVVDNGNDFAGTYSLEARKQARQRFSLPDDVPVLLFVGQHIYEKNLEFLLRSVAKLTDLNYRMFFVGTGYAAEALKQLSVQLGLSDCVSFQGSVLDRQCLRDYYLVADLFLFPSLYDNAPLVVREAAALHTPALMISGSTASAVIQDNQNGFLSTETTDDYAQCIRNILSDRSRLDRVAVGASQTLARSWEDIADEVSERYQRLITNYIRK